MEVAKTEAVESELDRIIEKRANERKDANHVEELWRESSRVHNERQRRINRWLWIRHFESLAACLRESAEEFDRKAEELMETNESEA